MRCSDSPLLRARGALYTQRSLVQREKQDRRGYSFAEGWLEDHLLNLKPGCYQRSGWSRWDRPDQLFASYINDNNKATSELYRKDKEGDLCNPNRAYRLGWLEGEGVEV